MLNTSKPVTPVNRPVQQIVPRPATPAKRPVPQDARTPVPAAVKPVPPSVTTWNWLRRTWKDSRVLIVVGILCATVFFVMTDRRDSDATREASTQVELPLDVDLLRGYREMARANMEEYALYPFRSKVPPSDDTVVKVLECHIDPDPSLEAKGVKRGRAILGVTSVGTDGKAAVSGVEMEVSWHDDTWSCVAKNAIPLDPSKM